MPPASPSSISSQFRRPLVIYDDKCYSCTKFARAARALSRGWVRIVGHYYSEEATNVLEMVLPPGYDATQMFWIVNRSGAYGARSGLLPLAREIVAGIFKKGNSRGSSSGYTGEDRGGKSYGISCEYSDVDGDTGGGMSASCYTPTNVAKRIAQMLSHGAAFPFRS